MIRNPTLDIERHTEQIRQARLELEATAPTPRTAPLLCDLADEAAALAEVTWAKDEIHHPSDRLPTPIIVGDAPESVEIDATDSIAQDLDEWDEGSAVHTDDLGNGVRINVSAPDVYVVDANGKTVPGGRVMVRFTHVTTDSP